MINTKPQHKITQFSKGCLFIGGILLLFCLHSPAQTPIASEPAPEDIRDIMVERPPGSIVPLVATIVLLTGVLIFGIFAIRKFMKKKPPVLGPPPEIVARRKLHAISGQVDELPPNKASLETSEAVKNFLTAQYQDPIRFETAEEYLYRITNQQQNAPAKLSPTLTEEVRSFVSISQELKFAQLKEARSRIPALIKQAETIVGMAVQENRPKKR